MHSRTAFIFRIPRRSLVLSALILLPLFFIEAETTAPAHRPKVALVLQGGGAMGIAHVGVIRQIEELGIPIDIVVGTSMGSIVGGLYSEGYTPDQLEKVATGSDWLSLFFQGKRSTDEKFWDLMDRSRYAVSFDFDRYGVKLSGGIISDSKIITYMDRLNLSVPNPVSFDSLPRQFRAVATDVATGERVVLDRGSLSDAMRASMSIPGVFSPYHLDGRYLVDGGIVDNLPVDVARELGADIIIAVQLTGGTPFSSKDLNRSPITALSRSLDILIAANVQRQVPQATWVLGIDLTGYQSADFLKGKEILAIGEKTAREHRADFEAIKKRIIELGGSEGRSVKPVALPIQAVTVEGAASDDEAKLLSRLRPMEGKLPDDDELRGITADLERRGNYQSIRLLRVRQEGGDSLLLKLRKKPPEKHAVKLGFSSATSYGQSLVSKEIISPGIVLRGLPFQGSRLEIGCSMMDRPGLEFSFLQPLGETFFSELSSSIYTDTNLYITDTTENHLSTTNVGTSRFRLGWTPFNLIEIAAGIRHDTLPKDNTYPDIPAGAAVTSEPLLTSSFRLMFLDSFIFPQKGLYLSSQYLHGIPGYEGAREFQTFETSGCLVPWFDIPLSLEIEWKYGTDFSEWGNGPNAAPAYYKPDLTNRRMFPDLMNIEEKVGSQVWGFSLLGKYQLNWARRALGMPTFVLLHGASGTALQDAGQITSMGDHSFWDADMGLGMRFNEAFGLMLRVGIASNYMGATNGFVAMDIGSFGIR